MGGRGCGLLGDPCGQRFPANAQQSNCPFPALASQDASGAAALCRSSKNVTACMDLADTLTHTEPLPPCAGSGCVGIAGPLFRAPPASLSLLFRPVAARR